MKNFRYLLAGAAMGMLFAIAPSCGPAAIKCTADECADTSKCVKKNDTCANGKICKAYTGTALTCGPATVDGGGTGGNTGTGGAGTGGAGTGGAGTGGAGTGGAGTGGAGTGGAGTGGATGAQLAEACAITADCADSSATCETATFQGLYAPATGFCALGCSSATECNAGLGYDCLGFQGGPGNQCQKTCAPGNNECDIGLCIDVGANSPICLPFEKAQAGTACTPIADGGVGTQCGAIGDELAPDGGKATNTVPLCGAFPTQAGGSTAVVCTGTCAPVQEIPLPDGGSDLNWRDDCGQFSYCLDNILDLPDGGFTQDPENGLCMQRCEAATDPVISGQSISYPQGNCPNGFICYLGNSAPWFEVGVCFPN